VHSKFDVNFAMKNISLQLHYCISAFMLLAVLSCSQNTETGIGGPDLGKDFGEYNRIILNNTDDIFRELEAKTKDITTQPKAEIWFPKAQLVRRISIIAAKAIDSMRGDFPKDPVHILSDAKALFFRIPQISRGSGPRDSSNYPTKVHRY
jgi:hypothetical protein